MQGTVRRYRKIPKQFLQKADQLPNQFQMFTIAMLIMGFGFTIYFPLTFEIIMRKAQKKFSGGLIGAYEATFGIGWAAGPLFAGIVSEFFGNEAPYLAFFIIGLIVTAIIIFNKNKLQLQWNQNL